jgi:hypothetical protein
LCNEKHPFDWEKETLLAELNRQKECTSKTDITEVFHAIAIIATVEIDIARRFPIFVQWVQEIATHSLLSRNVMFENVQTAICPS